MPKVAVVQFMPTFKDQLGNLRRMANLALEAVHAGAHLIVFPELATTGYSFMSKADAEPYTEDITAFRPGVAIPTTGVSPCPSMIMAYELAKLHNVHLAWGLAEKDAGTGQLYNTQVLMCPDGQYESMRKVNRWANDFLWSRPGRANPPILTCTLGGVTKKIGLLVCRDVRDKKDDHWDSFYQKGDADIVCLSANWGEGGFPATTWMEFVEDNNATLVVSNRFGEETDRPNRFGGGGVCVISPPDTVHCDGLVWNQDCIVYANI
jgi:predicted amidohydrolase